jgi:FkbM family methyltransferase
MKPDKASLFIHLVKKIYHHPANTENRLAPLARFLGWQIYKRAIGRSVTISIFDGVRWICSPESTAAGELLYANKGLCDFDEMSFMARFLRRGDRFLDVGANAGIYTVYAARLVGATGHVFAFEPDEVAFHQLVENVRLNRFDQVTAHRKAVGEEAGIVLLTCGKDTTNHMVASSAQTDDLVEVECVTLDEHFEESDFAMGKIDIEGAEPLAFRGAEAMLRRRSPMVWLLELNGLLHRFGFREEELVSWLFARGYRLACFDASRFELVLDQECWRARSNVFAIAEDRLDSVTDRLNDDRSRPIEVITR